MSDYDLIFLVGLPGSGKTYLGKTMEDRIFIDDPIKIPIFLHGIKYVVADCHLCLPNTFLQVAELYPNAFYYLFENDIEKCWENVKRRNDKRNITYEYLCKLSNKYDLYNYSILIKNKVINEIYGN